VVDLSSIKGDGGGTQYTFYEAIHFDCVLILNKKWITSENNIWEHKKNCYIIDGVDELLDILHNHNEDEYKSILGHSKRILERGIIETDWKVDNIRSEWDSWSSNQVHIYGSQDFSTDEECSTH